LLANRTADYAAFSAAN